MIKVDDPRMKKLRRYQRGMTNLVTRLLKAAQDQDKAEFERLQFELYQNIDDVFELVELDNG